MLLCAALPAAFLVSPSGAVPTGDSCTASGSGTAYTLVITIPGSAPQQGGFAVGASGTTIKTIRSTDAPGSSSTKGLPAGTSVALLLQQTALPGAVTVSVVTSSAVKSFSVDAANPAQTAFIDRFTCVVSPATAPTSNGAFTAVKKATYDAKGGTWRELVTVPAAGLLTATQQVASNQVNAAKPLVEASKVTAKSGGTYTLTLSLTGAGRTALTASGSTKIKLAITFAPKSGKHTTQMVELMLKR
jgi:hypothetical protein